MNSRERVLAAIHHQKPDRAPVYMWFHPSTAERLGKLLEVPPGAVGDVMGNDVRQTWANNNQPMEWIVHERDGEGHTDVWGVHWVREFGFNQIDYHPLARATPEEVLAYRFPVESLDELFTPMDQLTARGGDFFLGCDVSPCAFEMYWRLRGMEPAMLDLAENPELAGEMFQRCADFAILLSKEAMRRYPLDWVWTGDDVASQSGLMLSPRAWRKLVKPALSRVFDAAREQGRLVAYHCCGSLRPIIPDLVEMGMDVLNPIQANTPGMDLFELKREFGDKITFMGGVDTQDLLPNGTEREVRATVRKILDEVAADGGYILAASHTVPPETPDDNLFAMYAEVGISREEIFDRAADYRRGHA